MHYSAFQIEGCEDEPRRPNPAQKINVHSEMFILIARGGGGGGEILGQHLRTYLDRAIEIDPWTQSHTIPIVVPIGD